MMLYYKIRWVSLSRRILNRFISFISDFLDFLSQRWVSDIAEVWQHSRCKFFICSIYQLLKIFCQLFLFFTWNLRYFTFILNWMCSVFLLYLWFKCWLFVDQSSWLTLLRLQLRKMWRFKQGWWRYFRSYLDNL